MQTRAKNGWNIEFAWGCVVVFRYSSDIDAQSPRPLLPKSGGGGKFFTSARFYDFSSSLTFAAPDVYVKIFQHR
jgi:hypothetical protein